MVTISARDQQILDFFNGGWLLKDIGPMVGLSPHHCGQILKRIGVPRPSKPQRRWGGKDCRDEEIKALWSHGLCASQIAERISEPSTLVEDALSRLGVRDRASPRHRYDSATPGGSGKRGFAANAARRT